MGNSYIFVNGDEIYKLKAKDSEINAALLGLVNVSKNKKKPGLYRCVSVLLILFILLIH